MQQIPNVHGSKKHKCELTRTPYGRRFISEVCFYTLKNYCLWYLWHLIWTYKWCMIFKLQELNSYLKFLFELIAARSAAMGLNVTLNRFDLFHGHLFLAFDNNRLGILWVLSSFSIFPLKTVIWSLEWGEMWQVLHLAGFMLRNSQLMMRRLFHTTWAIVKLVWPR